MKRYVSTKAILLAAIILLAALSRLIHHVPNFSPIMAIALFGAAYFDNKYQAVLVPLAAMFISDIFLGFHETMVAVYLSFALGSIIGFLLLKQIKVGKIIIASLLSSVIFFILTNFAVWLFTGLYTPTFAGLTRCYTMAVPFFRYTLIGDLVYCGILFGSFALLEKYVPSLSFSEK